jgi:hypothetical protein
VGVILTGASAEDALWLQCLSVRSDFHNIGVNRHFLFFCASLEVETKFFKKRGAVEA